MQSIDAICIYIYIHSTNKQADAQQLRKQTKNIHSYDHR